MRKYLHQSQLCCSKNQRGRLKLEVQSLIIEHIKILCYT